MGWVPGDAVGEAHERLQLDITGLYGDLPPGTESLLELAAAMTARAFAAYAYAEGDWETCDALLAEGGAAAGGIFTALAERQLWTRVPIATVAPPHGGPTY